MMAVNQVVIRAAENRGFILRLEFIETYRERIANDVDELMALLREVEWRQPDGSGRVRPTGVSTPPAPSR